MTLIDFVRESNRIEGIMREPASLEISEFEHFLSLREVWVDDLKRFVRAYQPDAVIRDRPGLDVRVGNHLPPRGGDQIVVDLLALLTRANSQPGDAYDIHVQYETLHPFTDGNGRSGRALWAWCMGGEQALRLGFLHLWYYQSLDATR